MGSCKPLRPLLVGLLACFLGTASARADYIATNYDPIGDTYHNGIVGPNTAAVYHDIRKVVTTLDGTARTLRFDVFFADQISAPSNPILNGHGDSTELNGRIEIDSGLPGGSQPFKETAGLASILGLAPGSSGFLTNFFIFLDSENINNPLVANAKGLPGFVDVLDSGSAVVDTVPIAYDTVNNIASVTLPLADINGGNATKDDYLYGVTVADRFDTTDEISNPPGEAPLSTVPEPSSWTLGALGAAVLLGLARRRRPA